MALPFSRTTSSLALLAVLGLPLTACGQSDTPTATVDDADTSPETSAEQADAVAAYLDAVQRTIDSPTLLTTARIRVQTAGGVAEVVLEARRTPEGRTLTVTTDQGTLEYVVTPEGATVDRGDGPQPIEVAEVPATPSLAALLDVEGLTFPEDGVATGTLPRPDVGAEVEPVGNVVDVVVRYAPDGLVQGLEMRGPDDDYVAIVQYRTS